jgi:hypothetical protein
MPEKNRIAPPGFTWPENMESTIKINDMTEKEIRNHLDNRDRELGLVKYANEKQEINSFNETREKEKLSKSEESLLRLESMKIAASLNSFDLASLPKAAERIYNWITKSE